MCRATMGGGLLLHFSSCTPFCSSKANLKNHMSRDWKREWADCEGAVGSGLYLVGGRLDGGRHKVSVKAAGEGSDHGATQVWPW